MQTHVVMLYFPKLILPQGLKLLAVLVLAEYYLAVYIHSIDEQVHYSLLTIVEVSYIC